MTLVAMFALLLGLALATARSESIRAIRDAVSTANVAGGPDP
jgi:hypothetical protein